MNTLRKRNLLVLLFHLSKLPVLHCPNIYSKSQLYDISYSLNFVGKFSPCTVIDLVWANDLSSTKTGNQLLLITMSTLYFFPKCGVGGSRSARFLKEPNAFLGGLELFYQKDHMLEYVLLIVRNGLFLIMLASFRYVGHYYVFPVQFEADSF